MMTFDPTTLARTNVSIASWSGFTLSWTTWRSSGRARRLDNSRRELRSWITGLWHTGRKCASSDGQLVIRGSRARRGQSLLRAFG